MDAPTLQEILSAENAPIAVQTATFHETSGFAVEPFKDTPKRNHWASRGGTEISVLIMHYTGIPTHPTAQAFTRDISDGRVSAHYVITQKEQNLNQKTVPEDSIIMFVNENNEAWHAGQSRWQTDKTLNTTSIGIEHINPGFTKKDQPDAYWSPFGYEEDSKGTKWYYFDPMQIKKSITLAKSIVDTHQIHPTYILGHQDIAPGRKMDPGPLFPWHEFADAGVGAWLTEKELKEAKKLMPKAIDDSMFLEQLHTYGYDVDVDKGWDDKQNRNAFKAFKAHFSANMDLKRYMEEKRTTQDALWIWGLNHKYKKL